METSLWIEGVHFPEGSSRGCTQELYPIPLQASMFQRSVNGALLFLGDETSLKYRTVIQCKDQRPPVFSHKSLGTIMSVGCIQYIAEPLNQDLMFDGQSYKGTHLTREAVRGSLRAFVGHEEISELIYDAEKSVYIPHHYHDAFVFYRPILKMRLRDFYMMHNEWHAQSGWKITCDEV